VEFVPVDTDPACGRDVAFQFGRRRFPVLQRIVGNERFRPRVRGLHVAHPFARAEHVLLGQSAVVAQHVPDDRVDVTLQPVRGAGHRPTCGKRWLEKGEELPLAEQFLQPPVAAAQLPVRPPPHTSGRLGVGGVVPREGAFGDESFIFAINVIGAESEYLTGRNGPSDIDTLRTHCLAILVMAARAYEKQEAAAPKALRFAPVCFWVA